MLLTFLLLIPLIAIFMVFAVKAPKKFNTPYVVKIYNLIQYGEIKKFLFILSKIIAKITVIIAGIAAIILLILWLHSLFTNPVYCMDMFTEGYNDIVARISMLENRIDYFQDQARQTDQLFKQALRENLPDYIKEERLIAKRESETNLNVERKVLRTLRDRLASGEFNTSVNPPSSLGKRSFEK